MNPQQFEAVLAHERAHLRGRHHFVLMISAGVATARVSLLRLPAAVRWWVERSDDAGIAVTEGMASTVSPSNDGNGSKPEPSNGSQPPNADQPVPSGIEVDIAARPDLRTLLDVDDRIDQPDSSGQAAGGGEQP
ncbi:M48 family metalloprotease [Saccharopolyspora sp. 5N708]|uniref:M48 family metalloprotease n=1 Tax=Saccharopolyspora sp. 5N708 TaxID=3457424 RepID=UPI003FD698BC